VENELTESDKQVLKRRHPYAKCEECPLQEAGLFVPSDGPSTADIAFVGEAAGKNEVNVGKPFVGDSGKLLTQVLNHYGIDRRKVLLSNATLCRPPGTENLSPPQGAVKACRPRLVHEIETRGVKTVVALGNVAAQSLLASPDGVSKLRIGLGRKSPFLDNGSRVLATFHPAACLRSSDFFPSMVADIGKIHRVQGVWEPPKYVVYDTPEQAIAALREIKDHTGEKLVIDIETDKEKDTDFDHPNKYELLCIGLAYARKRVVVLEREALKDKRVLEALGETLRAKKLIAQNGKYDCAGLYPKVGLLKLYLDTMLASYALDERRGIHSLDYQAVEKLGCPNWKSALDKYNPKKLGYGIIPRDVLDQYNAYDCATTWELAEQYEEELEKKNLRKLHDFLVAAGNELMFLELNGITIDQKYNAKLTHEYLEVLDEIRTKLIATIDDPEWAGFNPNSPKQVKEVLEDTFGISIPLKRNQKGQLAKSTDAETLSNLAEKHEPTSQEYSFLSTMLEHREHAKLYGTYVKGIRARLYRGRVYPTFLLHGTTTGRLSCRNPNLQNIPRGNKIRSQFVPARDGSVFVSVDYSQAELRVLTWLAQEEYFRDIFNDGTRDLFDELAPVLYGDLSHLTPAEKKEKRIRVKAYVYGLSYGREAMSIAQEFRISTYEAVRGMEAFFDVIPNIVAYQKEVERTIRACEDLTTPFGRHRRFHLLTPNNITTTIKEGLAFRPQSISSDICLQAFTWARPALKGKAYIRNLVHDSILAECAEEDAEEVAKTLDELMLESAHTVVGDYVRFATEATIGKSWGDV
jgi:uracil-DNA glycosylase family 4